MTKTLPEARRCKRACCWTPYACARQYGCRCHAEPIGNLSARIRLEDFLDSLGDDE
ncbi:hypothetical protein [Pseudarthrobacter cellobiosi]|uniref:hypothetical protein n=1 Tax=Pseudarthrobacter cellobiosi TaxID=2953654 RepID=UPI00208E32BC|nr:hypothetical protein [Pseudarthrobacter sp. HLT1-5]MCO4257385.1 hypothetical protein [Pseudarthrobacter sp. HLT1-5]